MAGMRLAVALTPYWNLRAAYLEGRGWLTDFLARTDPAPTALRARTLYGLGMLAWFQCDYQAARPLLEQSVAMWQALGDSTGNCLPAASTSAYCFFHEGESDLAFAFWDACGKHFRSVGDSWGLAWTLAFLGRDARESGDFEAARVYYQESASLLRSIGDRWALSIVLSHLGLIAHEQKDYQTARTWFEYRIAVGRELASRVLCSRLLNGWDPPRWRRMILAQAAALFKKLTLSRPFGLDDFFRSRLFKVWRWSHNGEEPSSKPSICGQPGQTLLHARHTMWPSDPTIDDEAAISPTCAPGLVRSFRCYGPRAAQCKWIRSLRRRSRPEYAFRHEAPASDEGRHSWRSRMPAFFILPIVGNWMTI